jgi:ketosteroid isomerase-like protein
LTRALVDPLPRLNIRSGAEHPSPRGVPLSSPEDLDVVIERHHEALLEIARGRADGFKALYSRGDDATLANPFGPPARGWEQIERTLTGAARHYEDGEIRSIERIAKVVTTALAYTVELERFTARVAGAAEPRPVTLRVTTVFRPEDGTWRIVHRHADPIALPQPPESVLER